MNPKKILVLQGGNNEEHEISIATAKEVNIALKKTWLLYRTSYCQP